MIILTVFIVVVFGVSLASRKLDRSVVTTPIIFAAAGALTFMLPSTPGELALDEATLLHVAELGLVMLLFTDATRISPRMLTTDGALPLRLLSIGMLLTIGLGVLCALLIFGHLTWLEAGILAAILAPTDAGLGQVIVNSPRVPARIRQALNVEAGLNDGLSVPFLLFFIALAVAAHTHADTGATLMRLLVEQLGFGALVGGAIGLACGWLLALAQRRGWMADSMTQLGVVALPLLCLVAAHASASSAFIAAFVAGLAAQIGFRDVGRHSVEFTEDWGKLLNFFVFFLFGLLATWAWQHMTLAAVLYAVASLTLVRMLPVALALRGTGLSRASVLFIGWFGPRGLASIVLGLVYLEQQAALPGDQTIRLAVIATVLLSILAHGLSALPGIALYAKAVASLPPDAPERRAGDVDAGKPHVAAAGHPSDGHRAAGRPE
ncbi:MAG: cation:proton antiporter [Rhizobacter sp.]|nr:cation:proton antiporter [Rhizobacter sp.]